MDVLTKKLAMYIKILIIYGKKIFVMKIREDE